MRFSVSMFGCGGCDKLRVMTGSRTLHGQRYCHRCWPKLAALLDTREIARAGRSMETMLKPPAATAPEPSKARKPALSAMEEQDKRLELELRKRGIL